MRFTRIGQYCTVVPYFLRKLSKRVYLENWHKQSSIRLAICKRKPYLRVHLTHRSYTSHVRHTNYTNRRYKNLRILVLQLKQGNDVTCFQGTKKEWFHLFSHFFLMRSMKLSPNYQSSKLIHVFLITLVVRQGKVCFILKMQAAHRS